MGGTASENARSNGMFRSTGAGAVGRAATSLAGRGNDYASRLGPARVRGAGGGHRAKTLESAGATRGRGDRIDGGPRKNPSTRDRSPVNRPPRLFVPGFPKAGTTSVCAALAGHPSVFAPYTKEPHHWATDLPFYAEREGLARREAYLELYRRAGEEHAYALDGSTLYLYSEAAVPAIVGAVPDPRFIVCVRDVESMVVAWHGQMLAGAYEELRDLGEAWRASPARRAGRAVPSGCPDARLLDYQRIGLQGEQLRRLLAHVPAESVFVIRTRDLAADAAAAIARCFDFLGLEPLERIDVGSRNAAFVVRHRWARRLLYAPPIKRSVNRILNGVSPVAASRLRDLARGVVYREAPRAPSDEETLAAIGRHFADDQRLLRELLDGLPHTSWRSDRPPVTRGGGVRP